ncbi:androgen-induced gene 1 protein isoform X4 [Camelus ferus]|uniref:Androgen-induced gene 1 protein isoform X4 n=2 Tax=Camelus TaxID=9836 RepID=A0A8B8TFD8_CAMFR|nr:androgen-induced gene 1 protein isoform X4 [Camelus ferus]XP_045380690.1 androgen-induced gene 1 protein isoform X4 [Camelus bactrianus]
MALVPCQVLRVAILLSYCSILCNYKAIEMPSHQTYGGSWKFLTFIDLQMDHTTLIKSGFKPIRPVLSRALVVGSSCSN